MRARGWILTPVAVFAALVVTGCASHDRAVAVAQCTSGQQHPERPIVCVDDTGTTLSIDPKADLEVFERAANGAPVTILFFTKSGNGDLKIVDRDDCLADQEPTPAGMARIRVTKSAAKGNQRCKYDIELAGFPTLDPFIIVKPCCTLLDGPG